jgi:hypothetical protein
LATPTGWSRSIPFARNGFSDHFINVLTHAADQGAVAVRFDRDAEYEPGLPSFDWFLRSQ